MPEARITELNENEILKYLGYRGQKLGPETEDQLARCRAEILKAAQPRLVWKTLPVQAGAIEGMPLGGQDVAGMLAECQEAVLLGATLGADVERLLMKMEVVHAADAFVMDACASTAIENVCNNFEADLRRETEAKGLYLTDRFSPGYGDLPLAEQPKFFAALDMTRRIGVTLSRNHLMVPRKSVTAVMGISDRPQKHRPADCENCLSFRHCPFRKNGVTCRGDRL